MMRAFEWYHIKHIPDDAFSKMRGRPEDHKFVSLEHVE